MPRVVAPRHLSSRSKRLYRELVRDYALDREPHALETLKLACEALDRCEQARQVLAAEGAFVSNRFGERRVHPAVAVERDSRLAALRALRELSLDGVDAADVRPPRIG
jgi:phage terminase small subunit